MSLQTPKFIISALQNTPAIMAATDGRIFYAARDNAAEEEDKIPYIVVQPESVTEDSTKDGDGVHDTDRVGVLVVAQGGAELMDLAEDVRRAVGDAAETFESEIFTVDGLTFSAGAVVMDPQKPCYYQTLAYVAETTNL